MEIKINDNKDILYVGDSVENSEIYLFFPKTSENTHTITKVFVDSKYRGQGLASQLMLKVVDFAKKEGIKLDATCSYAQAWFLKNK